MVRRIMNALAWILGSLAAITLLVWLGQRRLIYFPDPTSPTPPADVVEVELDTEDGLTLAAWWLTPPADVDLAVIVFPGNAGNRAGRLPLARALVDRGMAVLLVDYRGYGGNPGSPSEGGLLTDARAARRWIAAHHSGRVIYLGESIGSGPAAALATEVPPDGLLLRSPIPSVEEMARLHYPWVPARLLLRDRYPVVEQVGTLDAPAMVVAGSGDTIVPLELSQQVAEAADADLIVVDGADHNDAELAWGSELVEAIVALGRLAAP